MLRSLWILPLVAACGGPVRPEVAEDPVPLSRLRFNQLALRLNLPLYWIDDANESGAPDPSEIATLAFYASAPRWTESGRFTDAFEDAYAAIQREDGETATSPRLQSVHQELGSVAPTLLHAELGDLPGPHQQFAEAMLQVGSEIDALYALQVGMTALSERVADDPASQSLFRRNWGPQCRSPLTESNPACSAIEGAPKQSVDVYPREMQEERYFCVQLEERADAADLLGPFTVVRADGDSLAAVPYHEAYAPQMGAIAEHLDRAREAIAQDPAEGALVAYLQAAAQAFRDNQWEPADEAWSRMNARNSSWYVRVAPDEVYWDPCSHKAGFHLTFARIDSGSLVWQDRLNPLQQTMEESLASLVDDEVYQARDASFHMPDFIAIVANFGDDRDPFGATIGQSLPNWGPVAEEGRGRTVAMTNLYTDGDSLARRRTTSASLFTEATMAHYTDDSAPGLMSTILHEATHNLGPASEYRVGGRSDEEIFGGGMASMLEELKAQSGALYFVSLLQERGLLTEAQARETYVDSIAWALGHISRGMYTPSGWRKAYSQLSAIQVGFLMNEGVITFDEAAFAANGTDRGAFNLDLERFPDAVGRMMTEVMRIKGAGDKTAAEALAARYVDSDVVPMSLITERHQRQPRASFVFSIVTE
ncbi:MAG: hypothetical protein AAGE52_38985 [Myxococcota bacterium]